MTEISTDDYPYVCMHYAGDNACGCEAFYLKTQPDEHDRITAEDAIYTDGEHPVEYMPITCSSCGQQFMSTPTIEHVMARKPS